MQFGLSYFGVRNPQHVQHDLDDIARLGFAYIVFTFSENDHRFYPGTMAECVRQAHERGLKVWVDPWGVCGIFGGEAFTERGAWDIEAQQQRSDGRPLPLLCLNSAEVRDYLRRWVITVAEVLQADAIFWDEPHFYLPFGEARERGLCRDRDRQTGQHGDHRPGSHAAIGVFRIVAGRHGPPSESDGWWLRPLLARPPL